jgi:elongation factor 1-beta
MAIKLYCWTSMHFFLWQTQIAAAVGGVEVEVVVVDEEMKADKAFQAKKGHGKFPMLELENGKVLFESVAIAAYLLKGKKKDGLLGKGAFGEAQVNQWTAYGTSNLEAHMISVLYNVFGLAEDKAKWEAALEKLGQSILMIESHMAGKNYLVGDSMTLADICVYGLLAPALSFTFGEAQQKACPNVAQWADRMSKNKNVMAVSGTWKLPAAAWKCAESDAALNLKKSAPVAATKAAEGDDDDIDMFGSDDEDDEASFDALCKAKQAAIDKANAKPKAVAKSIVMFEVKPLESETDLDVLFARILKEVQMEGCAWKQDCKKEPVAFGVFKLIVGAVIEDDKVSTDDIEEKIEGMDDMVQSVDIQSFNKL